MTSISPSSAHTTFHKFMNLPLDLRLKAYEFGLTTTATLELPDDVISKPIIFQDIALLCSSRDIHNEALSVFYAVNQFHFELRGKEGKYSIGLSKHYAMMRHISIEVFLFVFSRNLEDFAELLLTKILHNFRQLHSLCLFINETERYPSPDSTPEVMRDLRLRLKSISVILFVEIEEANKDADDLQELRGVIAPQDQWRQQVCNDWPHSPTWTLNTPDVGLFGYFRVWSTSRQGGISKSCDRPFGVA